MSRRLPRLIIAAAALLCVLPLLWNGCSCGHDFDFHLLNWLEAASQFAHGNLHPHWAYTPAFDAGESRFVFYPPLSWTLGALLTLTLGHLPHLPPDRAFALAPVVYTWIALSAAGLAMHTLARRYTTPAAALLAATFYLANPYTLFTAYERAAFAELLAAAWIPLLLLAILPPPPLATTPRLDRSTERNPDQADPDQADPDRPRPDRPDTTYSRALHPPAQPTFAARRLNTPLLALAIALLWLTNAPAAVMGCYTLALLALLHLLSLYRKHRTFRPLLQPASRYIAGAILGLALAAFYLVPAAYQRRWVEIDMAIIPGMRIADNTLFHHTPDPDHDTVLHTASLIAVTLLTLTTAALLSLFLLRNRRPRSSSSRPEPQTNPSSQAQPLGTPSSQAQLQTRPLSRPGAQRTPTSRPEAQGAPSSQRTPPSGPELQRTPSSRPQAQPEWRDPCIPPLHPIQNTYPAIPTQLLATLAVLTAAIALLLTPIAAPIWRHAPELPFLQFPWRLLAILAPVLALSLALILRTLPLRQPPIALALLLPAALASIAYPAFRQSCDLPDTPQAQLALFHSGAGADPTDEYTPITADNDALHPGNSAFTCGPTIISPAGEAPLHLTLDTAGCDLVLNLRDYPAWEVDRNGVPVPEHLDRPDGLLAFHLPPGHSSIDIRYRTTPDRTAGDLISVLALCLFVPLTALALRRHGRTSSPAPARPSR